MRKWQCKLCPITVETAGYDLSDEKAQADESHDGIWRMMVGHPDFHFARWGEVTDVPNKPPRKVLRDRGGYYSLE